MNMISLFPFSAQALDAFAPTVSKNEAQDSPFAALLALLSGSSAPNEEKDSLLQLLNRRDEEEGPDLPVDLLAQLEPLMASLLMPITVQEPTPETDAESSLTVPDISTEADSHESRAFISVKDTVNQTAPPAYAEATEATAPTTAAHAPLAVDTESTIPLNTPVETVTQPREATVAAATTHPVAAEAAGRTAAASKTETLRSPVEEAIPADIPFTITRETPVQPVASAQKSEDAQNQMLFQGGQNRAALLTGERFQSQSDELSVLRTPDEAPFVQELRSVALPATETTASPEVQLRTSILERLSSISELQTPLADGDKQEFTVSLKPDSLGEIKIRMVMESGKVSIALIADSEATRMMLQSRADALTESLRTQEVDLHTLTVLTQQSDTGSAFQGSHSGSHEQQATQVAKLASFPLAASEELTNVAPATNGALNLYA